MSLLGAFPSFFSKAAILVLLRQLFMVYKKMRIAITIGLIVNLMVYSIPMIVEVCFWIPRKGETWDDASLELRVDKLTIVGLLVGALIFVLDIYIFILPLPLISRIKVQHRSRVKLFLVFGTAFITRQLETLDGTYRGSLASTDNSLSTVENYVAIIVACMPSLARFLSKDVAQSPIYKTFVSRLALRRSRINDAKGEIRHTFSIPKRRIERPGGLYNRINNPAYEDSWDGVSAQSLGEPPIARLGGAPGVTRTLEVDQAYYQREVIYVA
ncbi:hypothetical protein M426DRAFT_262156 [Hypoxylon sp. CI-4A]|nr:hypothetical protein M426DRAFT_262156 [Hypoxylon sp. CI-4A]